MIAITLVCVVVLVLHVSTTTTNAARVNAAKVKPNARAQPKVRANKMPKPSPKPKPTPAPTPKPKPTPGPTPDCPECEEEWTELPDDTPLGACCFGASCLDAAVPEHRCRGVWAGPDTDCEVCGQLRPCCNPLTGECSQELCADCYKNGGTPVEVCEECEVAPTPAPAPTPRRKPPKPTPTSTKPPSPPPTPKVPEGACCMPDGSCAEKGKSDCWQWGGHFRGEWTWCEDDTCLMRCCTGALECAIVNGTDFCNAPGQRPGAFGTDCESDDACGVACCLGTQCTIAASPDECEECGGTPRPGLDCSDDDVCGGACCHDDGTCTEILGDPNHQCTADGGQYSEGKACDDVNCGGACCTEEDCMHVFAKEDCDREPGVYQGDGSLCDGAEPPTPAPTPLVVRKRDVLGVAPPAPPKEICLNDGACCKEGQCVPQPDSLTCFHLGGVWQGEGSDCQDDSIDCGCGACCHGRGCDVEQSERECIGKGGSWAGAGTNCDMPAVCDQEGGACCCTGSDCCIDMPNEKKCRAFGGKWQGVGSDCKTHDLCYPEQGEGACCIQKTYFKNGAICELVGSEQECCSKGGTWSGVGSTCGTQEDGSAQCRDVRGACCVPGDEQCYDDMEIGECRECGGHFAGEHTACSDQYVCDPAHKGACCKVGWPCKSMTHVKCLRAGGRFQGFETTCQDDGGDVCKVCLPCEVDQNDKENPCTSTADCAPGAVCLQQYGLCAVPAYRIPSEYHQPPAPPGMGPPSSSSSSSSSAGPIGNIGPLSCGNSSTIGQACVVHPAPGKCGIGVCQAPPDGHQLSDDCESVCRDIREYECGCDCQDAWLATCASVAGHVFHDQNANNMVDGPEGGVAGARVQLFSRETDHYAFVAEEITQAGGHYAFGGIPGGTYKVVVTLPEGLGFGGDGKAYRKVTVECYEEHDGDDVLQKRSAEKVRTQRTYERKFKANHLAEDIDFFAVPGEGNGAGSGGDDDEDDFPNNGGDSGGGGSGAASHSNWNEGPSTLLVLGIVLGVFLVLGAVVVIIALSSRPRGARRRNRRRD